MQTDHFLNKPEVFWVGVQSLCAVAGLIGLIAYVIDTARIRWLAQAAKRASITPVFSYMSGSAQQVSDRSAPGVLSITVRNVGEGTAVLMDAWHQPVTDQFVLRDDETVNLTPGNVAVKALSDDIDLMKGEKSTFDCRNWSSDSRWLFVLGCTDVANGKHQFQILMEADGTARFAMAHNSGDSWGEIILRMASRYFEIVRRLDTVYSAFEDDCKPKH